MALVQQIQDFARSISADFKEKKGLCELNLVVAQRKAFLSKQKLTYQAKLRVDDKEKTVRFTELLKETSSGMESPGFSSSSGTFRTAQGGRQAGYLQQQADFFSKKYEYDFDFKTIRSKIESLSQAAGYAFQYQITSKGL